MISTSKKNRELVSKLTRRLGLGYENHVSRIAFSYSINKEEKLNLSQIQDSKGKTYSRSVFFGDHFDLYVGLICVKYGLHSSDKDILKYVKMHVDDGLESLDLFVDENGITNNLQLLNLLI